MDKQSQPSFRYLLDELIKMKLLYCATVNGVDLKAGYSDAELKSFCELATLEPVYLWYGTAWFANGSFAIIREINGGAWWDVTHVPPIPERLK